MPLAGRTGCHGGFLCVLFNAALRTLLRDANYAAVLRVTGPRPGVVVTHSYRPACWPTVPLMLYRLMIVGRTHSYRRSVFGLHRSCISCLISSPYAAVVRVIIDARIVVHCSTSCVNYSIRCQRVATLSAASVCIINVN